MNDGFDGLLASLRGVPPLPGAKCRGRSWLFDPPGEGEQLPDVEHRHRIALDACQSCLVLTRCADWLNSLRPKDRPLGVTAGTVRNPKKPTKKETAA